MIAVDIDQLYRDADPGHGLTIEIPDPTLIRRSEHDQAASPQPSRSWAHSAGRRLPLAASIAVVIAVVAVILLTGAQPNSPRPAETPATQPTPPTRSALAVFRRVQTVKDRTMGPILRRAAQRGGLGSAFAQRILNDTTPGSARYAQTLPDGREVFVARTTTQASLQLLIIAPSGRWTEGQPIISPQEGLPSNRIARIEALAGPGCYLTTKWSIVPDGVTRVRWQFPRQDRAGFVYQAPLTVDVPVHGNTAVATIPGRASCDKPSVITLYGPGKQIVASHGNSAELTRIARPIRHGDPLAGIKRFEHRPAPRHRFR